MEKRELVIIRYLISETSVLATNTPATGCLVSPVYPNPGQVFLPISSYPSLQADLQIIMKVKRAAGGHNSMIWIFLLACQISLALESYNNSCLLSSDPGDELREWPRVSQECLCLAWQVASLPYSGQDVGVEHYFCFLLEVPTVARTRQNPFDCPEKNVSPFRGQREI